MSRRVQKQVSTYDGSFWVLETAKSFVYDGWNVIKEHTTTGSTTSTAYYVWGLDLSGTLHGAGGIGGLLMRKSNTGSYLYLYDANRNVQQLVNAADGSVAAWYKYTPFGGLLVADGPEAESNPFRFSTKYYDAETGLYYYGYRYYDPVSGRWWTRDPVGEDGGMNLYEFVRNNAVNRIDPFGLWYVPLPTDWLALWALNEEEEICYRKWRDPWAAPRPPLQKFQTLVEASPEYQQAKQELKEKLQKPCSCNEAGTDDFLMDFGKRPDSRPLGFCIGRASLWQRWRCQNGQRKRTLLYTCDVYNFDSNIVDYPWALQEGLGYGVPYKFYLFHEPGGKPPTFYQSQIHLNMDCSYL